jgi:hypothetical protein
VRFNYKYRRAVEAMHEARWPWPPETFGMVSCNCLSHATRWAGDNDSCALCLLQVHLHSTVLRCKLPNAEVARTEKRKIDADASESKIFLFSLNCVCVLGTDKNHLQQRRVWWFLIYELRAFSRGWNYCPFLFSRFDAAAPHFMKFSPPRAAPRTDADHDIYSSA